MFFTFSYGFRTPCEHSDDASYWHDGKTGTLYHVQATQTEECEAEDRARQVLRIFQRIGAAEAAEEPAELDALTEKAPRKDKLSAPN